MVGGKLLTVLDGLWSLLTMVVDGFSSLFGGKRVEITNTGASLLLVLSYLLGSSWFCVCLALRWQNVIVYECL